MSAALAAGLAALAATAGAVTLGVLAVHYRRRWKAAEALGARAGERVQALEATLASAPLGCLILRHSEKTAHGASPLFEALGLGARTEAPLAVVLEVFDAASVETLTAAVERLRGTGEGFTLSLRRKDGARVFEAAGVRAGAASGEAASDVVWLHDVTGLHAAMARAEAERGALAGLLDALPLPIWRRDTDLRLVYCNAAYGRAVAREPAAALTEAIELLGRSKSEAGRALARRALESGVPAVETHHAVADGARRLLVLEERPLDGGTLGHVVDRTDAEELETELTRHVAAHDEVLENLGSAIAIFGSDLRLRFFNTAYARLWHLDEAYLHTEPEFGDILEVLRAARRLPEHANFPEFKREWIRSLRALIEPVETLLHLPNGSTLRSLASPHPFGGVLLTYEDVTDRLSLERSYNTLIDVQRETLDNLYEGVAVYGADGRLKLFNPAFARIWNLPEDLLGAKPHVRELLRHARELFGEVSDGEWEERLEARVARATEPEPRSGRRERADRSVVDWALVPLPDGASLFTFLDVTDSIRVERALRERNEALETADRLKSEFVANISYELRTPLNAIVGFAEILENQFFGSLNARQLEYSHGIVEASQRLIALINDILDLATIEGGYMQLDLAPVDVKALMESIQTLGHERAHNREIELRIECPPDIGTLTADGRRLKQALFNLLSNAFKFTPEGGSVTVSAARADGELLLTVVDTGIGIREEDIARVFGKFERGKPGTGQTGAGLGLSLVKSLIELHGGWVELFSAPHQGTRVTCHVPLDGAAAQAGNRREPLRA